MLCDISVEDDEDEYDDEDDEYEEELLPLLCEEDLQPRESKSRINRNNAIVQRNLFLILFRLLFVNVLRW